MADIERILQRLEAIEAEVRELKQVLRDLDQPTESSAITAASDAATKLELYLSRFAGRRDVYAQAWESRSTGKKGWSPAVRGGFFDRQKLTHDFLPLTDDVLYRHLQGGGSPIGLYVTMPGDQCQLLACDFDGHSWREDAAAYAEACREQGLDPLCEISRSGDGAHVWLFFEAPVPAASARSAGFSILRSAMRMRPTMDLESYDRFFPAQDTLSTRSTGAARLGNLIALPLHGDHRRRNRMVFADPATWEPLPDQFAALAAVTPTPQELLESISARVPTFGPDPDLPRRPAKQARKPPSGVTVVLTVDNAVHIPTAGLPSDLVSELKHRSAIPNPEFYRRQAQRMSTFGVPRLVIRFEHDDNEIRLPRGLLDEALTLLDHWGLGTKVQRRHPSLGDCLDVSFSGELRPAQKTAMTEVLPREFAVLVAPPGTGKTVVACSIIAERRVPTAILVNRAELLNQWRSRLSEFLDLGEIKIGQLGSGRRKLHGQIDLIMLQSISRKDSDPCILENYGQIIVDECHNIAAPAAEDALHRVNVRHVLGLTATPYRSDRMDEVITMQCGPIAHTLEVNQAQEERHLVVHHTNFRTEHDSVERGEIQEIYNELAVDPERNSLIASTVADEVERGRNCLVLVNRLAGMRAIAAELRSLIDAQVLIMHGGQKKDERASVRAAVVKRAAENEPFVLVAMGKVAGEGLDLPALHTLFLAAPISFKGVVVQQLGRITRSSGGEAPATAAVVHDFVDDDVAVLQRMHRRRFRTMQKEGFILSSPGDC